MSTLPPHRFTVTRADLVRYAGAAGDFNPIHYSDRVATAVGLPGVIAHGMLTMALTGNAVAAWAGGVGNVLEFAVRFTRPVVVPDDDTGVQLEVTGELGDTTPEGTATITLTCTCNGEKVLGAARAVVRRSGPT